jgi:hypothetical protein
MHTLDSSKDTSIPAWCSIAVLHLACSGANEARAILAGTATLPARSRQGPLRHLTQLPLVPLEMLGVRSAPAIIAACFAMR